MVGACSRILKQSLEHEVRNAENFESVDKAYKINNTELVFLRGHHEAHLNILQNNLFLVHLVQNIMNS